MTIAVVGISFLAARFSNGPVATTKSILRRTRSATSSGRRSLFPAANRAAFFNPPDSGVTSGEFEYVQRVVEGVTLVLGTGERVRLIGVNMR
jgi:hypothetical protein